MSGSIPPHYSSQKKRERKMMRKGLMGWDKNREIALQLLSQANKTQRKGHKYNLLPVTNRLEQWEIKIKLKTTSLHPSFSITSPEQHRIGNGSCGPSIALHHQPLLPGHSLSPAPLWSSSHRILSFLKPNGLPTKCSSSLCFFKNCCNMGPSYGVQSFRNGSSPQG